MNSFKKKKILIFSNSIHSEIFGGNFTIKPVKNRQSAVLEKYQVAGWCMYVYSNMVPMRELL